MTHRELKDDLLIQRNEVLIKIREAKKDKNADLISELNKKYFSISSKISYYNSLDNDPNFMKKKNQSTAKSINKAFDNSKKYRELMSNLSSIVSTN